MIRYKFLFITLLAVFAPWDKLVHFLAILGIFGIFVAADAFHEVGTGRKEDDEQQGSNHAPVDDTDTGTDGKDVETHPNSLLGHIVGVTAHAP